MANKKGDTTRIQAVPDVNKCTNLGCYSMKEREAYAVKTRKDQMLSTIYYFPDFQKPYTKTFKVEKGALGHGNGMCCAEKYMFFGCWVKDPDKSGREQQNYLIRVKYGKLTDNLTNGIKISVPVATGAIAFYKKSHLIIKVKPRNGYLTFMMGKILINENGTAGRFDTLWTFYVKNTTGFSRGQDIYYDAQTDCLFIPQCNDHNNVNKIMVVNLSGESETYKGNKLYTPQDIITVDKRKDYSKYEIESLVIAPKRHIVMVANIVPKGTITADDAVERISNLKF